MFLCGYSILKQFLHWFPESILYCGICGHCNSKSTDMMTEDFILIYQPLLGLSSTVLELRGKCQRWMSKPEKVKPKLCMAAWLKGEKIFLFWVKWKHFVVCFLHLIFTFNNINKNFIFGVCFCPLIPNWFVSCLKISKRRMTKDKRRDDKNKVSS